MLIKKYRVYVALFAIVAINLFLFSTASPIHDLIDMQYNEWLYYIIGKGMKYGKVPYVDLIDHKGIYLFFLFYFASIIGEWQHVGLYILALIFYALIAIYTYKISYLILDLIAEIGVLSKKCISFLTAVTIYAISSSYYLSFGTICSETFILSFVLIAYFTFLQYLLSDSKHHKVWVSFLYGVLAGFSFFIKANGVLTFVSIAIVLLIVLVREKEYINLINNIILGIFGFVISLLPGITYSLINNCFGEMIESSFFVNMLYTGTGLPAYDSVFESLIATLDEFKEFMIICLLGSYIFCYIIVNARNATDVQDKSISDKNGFKKFYATIFCILCFLINVYAVLMSARPYTNYLNFLVPCIIPFVLSIYLILDKVFVNKQFVIFKMICLIILINILSYSMISELAAMNGYAQKKIAKDVVRICKNNDALHKDMSALVVGYAPYIYDALNVLPNEKYFATPVVSREKYSEPYDALISRVLSGLDDVVVVSFERSMLKDDEFKENVYKSLDTSYLKIGDTKSMGVKAEIFVKRK